MVAQTGRLGSAQLAGHREPRATRHSCLVVGGGSADDRSLLGRLESFYEARGPRNRLEDLMARRRALVGVMLAMLLADLALPSLAQTAEATINFQAHGSATSGTISLPVPVNLATAIFVPRLSGGDGAVAALVLRNGHGTTVFRAIFVNPPGFDMAVPISADQGVRLSAGRYSFGLAGAANQGLPIRASGLKKGIKARAASRTSRLRVRLLTNAKDSPGADAWFETASSQSHAESIVVAFAASAGPGQSSMESICLSQALSPTCIEPERAGSSTSLTGPWLPPLPAVATQHAHLSWLYFGSLTVPAQGLSFRGTVVAGTDTWHGVLQLTE
jgi:hypothetical protein